MLERFTLNCVMVEQTEHDPVQPCIVNCGARGGDVSRMTGNDTPTFAARVAAGNDWHRLGARGTAKEEGDGEVALAH